MDKIKELLNFNPVGFYAVDECDGILLSIDSEFGQDFGIYISNTDSIESIYKELVSYCDDYDVSEEAGKWLDDSGHGTNGAPYDMRDILDDAQWCLDAAKKLTEYVKKLVDDEQSYFEINYPYYSIISATSKERALSIYIRDIIGDHADNHEGPFEVNEIKEIDEQDALTKYLNSYDNKGEEGFLKDTNCIVLVDCSLM